MPIDELPYTDYKHFANAIESKVDMANIKDRNDLQMRLDKFFIGKKDRRGRPTREPTHRQINALSDYYDIGVPKKVKITRKDSFMIGKTLVTRNRDPKTGRFVKL